MAAALGVDLGWRVVQAIEDDGPSTREAGRRFCVGESTAGRWHRLWRASGEVTPGRKGNPDGSRLDVHEAFFLELIAQGGKDVTLAEMAARLEAEHGERVDPSTIWHWLDRRGITYNKKRAMRPSRSAKTSQPRARPGSPASSTSTRKS